MAHSLSTKRQLLLFGIPLLLQASAILFLKSAFFIEYPVILSRAVTIDLVLSIPLIYYLIIRKTTIPKITIVPLFLIGIFIGTFFIPAENQQYLRLFKIWALPLIEIFMIGLVIFNVRKAIKEHRIQQKTEPDFFTSLKNTCYRIRILPKRMVNPFATEIAAFYYGFIHWKKTPLKENEFSYHKDSGSVTLLGALIFIIAIETVVFHLLIAKWSTTAAWILTISSAYIAIQFFGFIKSMFKRPIVIKTDKLLLRYGMMNEATINFKDIQSIEISSRDIELNTFTRKLSILKTMENHNIIIHLYNENTLHGLYGIKRNFKVLALYVDNNVAFKRQLEAAIQHHIGL